jgi:hypothetical protein
MFNEGGFHEGNHAHNHASSSYRHRHCHDRVATNAAGWPIC